MPVYSRKVLRQTLGRAYVRDMVSSTTTATINAGGSGGDFASTIFRDGGLAGQGLYQNAMLWHAGASGGRFDWRVATFNAVTGTFTTLGHIEEQINAGEEFEVHSRLPASEKNLALDETLKSIRVRQEAAIATGTAGADFFSIEGAGSPHYITDVLDAYWFANPSGSLDRDLRRFSDFRLVMTATGREIRVTPAPGNSAQLVLDAVLQLTLGSSDVATINIPDQSWLLAGAAAHCYNLMVQNAPGQNAGNLVRQRDDWANTFSQLSSRFAPSYTHKVRLEEPEDQSSLIGQLTW